MKLCEDIRAYIALTKKGGKATLFDISFVFLILYRLSSSLYNLNKKIFFPVRIIEKLLEIIFGIYIPFGAKIGGGLIIYHCNGIIINGKTTIGNNCQIYARVCIGNRYPGDGVPVIGDNVIIGTGACIFGPVFIPDGARISANVVITPGNIESILQLKNKHHEK
ncbi:serine O-acetyltransferase [Escherichia coli]|uniref:serine O-acetyltransferase n=1 Tax=Escherichia coli TaxID=562 RepID=UPI001D511D1E|nr:hypothetical protein [Escherichia coli]